MKRGLLAGFVAVALALAAPGPAAALDAQVESFDGIHITTHFYPAAGLEPGDKAPTILIGHGWGGSGEAASGSPAPFIADGYNVLTWDARGFGTSEGIVMIDHPKFEAKDVSALIDFVAEQPEAQLDKPGDPRVGMSGGSYGGGIQFITAARDKRVDVITPTIPWHNLMQALYPYQSVKAGWDLALVGAGIPTASVPQGVFDPAGIPAQGGQSPHFYNAVQGGLSTGQIPDSEIAWFEEHGPDFLLKKIKIPTLIAQGTVDTLFDLNQGHRNYQALKKNKIPLKMMWFCGGHGVCNVDSDSDSPALGDSERVQMRRLQWFDRYLKGHRKTRTGPPFEWIDQNADWHTSPGGYPLKHAHYLSGTGGGTVPVTPGSSPATGALVLANPDPSAPIKVAIPAEGGEEIVGAPTLRFTYTATGASTRLDGKAHIYGQIVDNERDVVVGNQATPIPIKFDGEEHTIRANLTRIANVASPEGFELQLVSQSSLYDIQRAAGAVSISDLVARLPITKPRKK
jgi:ABC-2 type transport system ATP-binding protein